jgi:hypothetical protein
MKSGIPVRTGYDQSTDGYKPRKRNHSPLHRRSTRSLEEPASSSSKKLQRPVTESWVSEESAFGFSFWCDSSNAMLSKAALDYILERGRPQTKTTTKVSDGKPPIMVPAQPQLRPPLRTLEVTRTSSRVDKKRLAQRHETAAEKRADRETKRQKSVAATKQSALAWQEVIGWPIPEAVCHRLDQTAEGSHMRKEQIGHAKEACHTSAWIFENHPGWVAEMMDGLDSQSARETLITTLFSKGKNLVASARRSIQRLHRWCINRDYPSSGPFSAGMVAAFLISAADEARSNCTQADLECKETTADALRKALANASALFGAPIPQEALAANMVRTISKSGKSDAASTQSEMPLSHALWIESLALGEYYEMVMGRKPPVALSPAAVEMVRVVAIAIRTNCRLSELLHMSVLSLSRDKAIIATVPKAKSVQAAATSCLWVPVEGLLAGSGLWFQDFMRQHVGKSFIVRRLAPAQRGKQLLSEFTRLGSDACADYEQLSDVWYCLMQMSPLHQDRERCRELNLTPYATRHLLPAVALAWRLPFSERTMLGGWSAVKHAAAEAADHSRLGKPMGDRYAATTEVQRSFQVRSDLLARVRAWVGEPRTWQSKCPMRDTHIANIPMVSEDIHVHSEQR